MTKNSNPPIPDNELERLLALSAFDLDYSGLSDSLKDLTQLAAKVAGTRISLVNLIDSYTQWSVARHGIDLQQMTREDSVCQYTITEKEQFEVSDLSTDERFKDKSYVQNPLALRYYFGIPLKSEDGHHLGALCVLDSESKQLSPEKIELLKIVAAEVINRIKVYASLNDLKQQLDAESETKRKVAHDIRGPLAGIIGLSEIVAQQGKNGSMDDILDFVQLIHKSSRSLLELTDEILTDNSVERGESQNDFNLSLFKEKLIQLYLPQAQSKSVILSVIVNEIRGTTPFSKNKLLQITGNLISNAIKFTPANGYVMVSLDLLRTGYRDILSISVKDSGLGISEEAIGQILSGKVRSTSGTTGEEGYGFGLALVQHLVDRLGGTLVIHSVVGEGTEFLVTIPQTELAAT